MILTINENKLLGIMDEYDSKRNAATDHPICFDWEINAIRSLLSRRLLIRSTSHDCWNNYCIYNFESTSCSRRLFKKLV